MCPILKISNTLTMSMYFSMRNYIVGMDDLASRRMSCRSCSSTTSVTSHTKSSSPIYRKERGRERGEREREEKKKGGIKRRAS